MWILQDFCHLLLGIVNMSLRAGGGATRKKVLAVSFLKRSPRSYTFLQSLFPLPSRRRLQSLLNTFQFGTGINANVFSVLKDNVQIMSDKDCMCCLMFDEMSIREHLHFSQKTVLKALRTLEDTAGQAISQIMPWSSCSVVYVKGGNNQLLTT